MSAGTELIKALTAAAGVPSAAATPSLNDNTTKVATTEFVRNEFTGAGKQSIGASGYQRLPGGLTLHWGTHDVPSGGGLSVITVPNVTTALIWCVGNIGTPTGSNNFNIGCSLRVGFPTHLVLQNTDSLNHGVYWMALSN
jgi:hypothetical protein